MLIIFSGAHPLSDALSGRHGWRYFRVKTQTLPFLKRYYDFPDVIPPNIEGSQLN
jgi:hypothetical protein